MSLTITLEGTPNPNAMKFALNRTVQYNGNSTYLTAEDAASVPMAQKILEIPGVVSVFLMDTFLTVSKTGLVSWEELTPQIEEVIQACIDAHDPAIIPQVVPEKNLNQDDRLVAIEGILDREIRPGLAMDGGGLEVIALEGNTLKVKYQGACGSCPSAATGTLMGIQDVLRRQFDPMLTVMQAERPAPAGGPSPFTSLFKSV